ncbi:phosphodiesterase [Maioricimonas rarisocia]|uniref:Phosphoesterase n=1 Tax=Maioricimonas rarisocia TaxID=2528026 RepID=A0A517ZE83_9PLAN|nr:YfcE family phosphodiesterase [Maioricimonas rarisocia]QDU40792.1 phosphodiesterase [Maioricimonas rarisocia]
MTRIAIVSDTHGHVPNTLAAIERLGRLDVSQVIHCGDIGSASIVPLFESWPTHFVFGNVDGNEASLRMAIADAGQTCHERFGELELDGRRIAFLHSDDARRFRSVIDSQEYDLVCYGHTHSAEHHHDGETLVLNPGALYRAQPHTLAVVDLPELTVESIVV